MWGTGGYKEVLVMLEEGGCSHNQLLMDPETPQLLVHSPRSLKTQRESVAAAQLHGKEGLVLPGFSGGATASKPMEEN